MTKYLLLLLAIAVAPAYGASIYKWTDKEGQVHYTRTPPPKSMTNEKVESREAEKVPAARIEETPVVKESAKQPPTSPEMSSEAKRRQELCQSAQYSLNEMRRTDKVIEHGHEIEITEDERLSRINELNERIKKYCTPHKPQPVQLPGHRSAPQPAPQPIQNPAPTPPQNMEKSPEQKIVIPQTQSSQ